MSFGSGHLTVTISLKPNEMIPLKIAADDLLKLKHNNLEPYAAHSQLL